jgi:hypothetical protein
MLCGATNYPLSLGGPSICPSCDCGNPPAAKAKEYYSPNVLSEGTKEKLDELLEGLRFGHKHALEASAASPDGPYDDVYRKGLPKEQGDEDLRRLTLPEWCQALHTSLWGAGDPLPDDERRKIVSYLKQRLRDWQPSILQWALFDESVRMMIVAVLHEVALYEAELAKAPTKP